MDLRLALSKHLGILKFSNFRLRRARFNILRLKLVPNDITNLSLHWLLFLLSHTTWDWDTPDSDQTEVFRTECQRTQNQPCARTALTVIKKQRNENDLLPFVKSPRCSSAFYLDFKQYFILVHHQKIDQHFIFTVNDGLHTFHDEKVDQHLI